MTDYSKMSDFEINKAVAIAQGYPEEDCDFGWTGKPDVGVQWNEETGYPTKSFNFCNSWADAGPIIQQNNISLLKCEQMDSWVAGNSFWVDGAEWSVDWLSNDKNPIKAAMICYLMMKEPENDS